MNFQTPIYLQPPLLSDENIHEKISCIRGHRERIFNTQVEHKEGKLIFHNYGQGGAGWTFLFGCVQQTIQQFTAHIAENPALKKEPLCIVGAGCYGLLTAIELARLGCNVRIVSSDTYAPSSYKAAGFFFPRPRKSSTAQEKSVFFTCGSASYATYLQIVRGEHPFLLKGASILPAYFGLDIDPGFTPYIEHNLLKPPTQVTIDFGNGKSYPAMAYNTVWIDATELMNELHRNIQLYHITIQKTDVTDLCNLPERIIFNCTGLGAKALTNDARLVPVQGHLIQLHNQPNSLNYLLNFKVLQQTLRNTPRDELIYFAPKNGGVLGVTFLRGQDNEFANAHEFERLLERCKSFFGHTF